MFFYEYILTKKIFKHLLGLYFMLEKTLKEFKNVDEVLKEFHEFEEENRVKKQLIEDRDEASRRGE